MRNTVFILGAGASAHLGFPLGTALKKEVESVLDKLTNYDDLCDIPNEKAKVLIKFLRETVSGARTHAKSLAERLKRSHSSSVDAFLERADSEPLTQIGKAVIAYCLSEYEDTDALHPSSLEKRNENWYRYVCSPGPSRCSGEIC